MSEKQTRNAEPSLSALGISGCPECGHESRPMGGWLDRFTRRGGTCSVSTLDESGWPAECICTHPYHSR